MKSWLAEVFVLLARFIKNKRKKRNRRQRKKDQVSYKWDERFDDVFGNKEKGRRDDDDSDESESADESDSEEGRTRNHPEEDPLEQALIKKLCKGAKNIFTVERKEDLIKQEGILRR